MFRPARCGVKFASRLPREYVFSQRKGITRLSHHASPVTVQPVRVRKWWSSRRMYTTALYTGTIGGYLWWLLDVEDDEQSEGHEAVMMDEDEEVRSEAKDEAEDEVDGKEEEGEESDGESTLDEDGERIEGGDFEFDPDPWFIPLTWAKKLPREYYKGSDPEWQEFRKMAPDTQKAYRIFALLADQVASTVAGYGDARKLLGKNMHIRRYWFDMHFPYGPPQDYARWGIEIGATYIALSAQVVPAQRHKRISNIIWPAPYFMGFYSYWRTLWAFQTRRLKESFGLDVSTEPGSHEHRINKLLTAVKLQDMANAKDLGGKPQAVEPSHKDVSPTESDFDQGVKTPPQDAGRGHSSDAGETTASDKPTTLDIKGVPHGSISILRGFLDPAESKVASIEAMNTIGHMSRAGPTEPPRGNCVIAGTLQLVGDNATMMLDVVGYYDPKAASFSMVRSAIRRVKMKTQRPRGGP